MSIRLILINVLDMTDFTHKQKSFYFNNIISQYGTIIYYMTESSFKFILGSFSHSLFMRSTSRDRSGKQPPVMSERALAF